MHRDQIRAPFEPLHQLRQVLRRFSEIALQQHHRIPTRVFILGRNVANQSIDTGRVTPVTGAANDGERHDRAIRLEHLVGAIVARVVIHDDVVFPGETLKHRTQAPQQDANGGGLVVDRDADAEHVGRVGGNAKRVTSILTRHCARRSL